MITEQDINVKINAKIDEVCESYIGNGQDLIMIVGMIVVGQRYGWRVIRLIMTRRLWTLACANFGDLKELLSERGELSRKSLGLKILDRIDKYWEAIRGQEKMDSRERRMFIDS